MSLFSLRQGGLATVVPRIKGKRGLISGDSFNLGARTIAVVTFEPLGKRRKEFVPRSGTKVAQQPSERARASQT
jgi:hypothetical protein